MGAKVLDDFEFWVRRVNLAYQNRGYKIVTKIAKANCGFRHFVSNQFDHNTRADMPNNAIESLQDFNKYSCSTKEAEQKFCDLLNEARQNYYDRTKQKIQVKDEKLRVSAVVNINEEHSLADIERVAKKIEQKYGLQVIQCAIHRDEGHFINNDDGSKTLDLNLHAHIEFFTLNKDGIYCYKKKDWYKMGKELQTLVADELKMERGKDYKALGQKAPKGLSHRQYAAKKAMDERAEAKIKDLTQINKELREQLKQNGANRADYAKLEQEIKELKEKIKAHELSKAELNKEITALKAEFETQKVNKEKLLAENSALKEQIEMMKHPKRAKSEVIAEFENIANNGTKSFVVMNSVNEKGLYESIIIDNKNLKFQSKDKGFKAIYFTRSYQMDGTGRLLRDSNGNALYTTYELDKSRTDIDELADLRKFEKSITQEQIRQKDEKQTTNAYER